ncbi:pentapeptide repeat-containing protein [Photobacterium galatheae]|nr:pentapeptide repeat-containing protein [Photobacterium galatheae]MCM0148030.1 pentapeptide repeat-containing protein [Photobacterium galatheae]
MNESYNDLKKTLSYIRKNIYLKGIENSPRLPAPINYLMTIILFFLFNYFHSLLIKHYDFTINDTIKIYSTINLKNLHTIINPNYSMFIINLISVISISIVYRRLHSTTIALIILFAFIEFIFFLKRDDIISNVNTIIHHINNMGYIYLIIIASSIAYKSKFIRLTIYKLLYKKTYNYRKTKLSEICFSGIELWNFIEISMILTLIICSFFLFMILITLLTFGKFHSTHLSFINDIYPRIDVSDKQVFELSKSSNLFEINNLDSYEFTQSIKTLRGCVSYSNETCHYIDPIKIKNRNLLFANFSMSKMYQVEITNSDLRFSNFYKSHLEGSKIHFSNLSSSNFTLAFLQGSEFLQVIWDNSKLMYTNLSESGIYASSLIDVNMCHVSLNYSSIRENKISCSSEQNIDKNCNCNISISNFSPLIIIDNKISNLSINFLDNKNKSNPIILFRNNKKIDGPENSAVEFNMRMGFNSGLIYITESDYKITTADSENLNNFQKKLESKLIPFTETSSNETFSSLKEKYINHIHNNFNHNSPPQTHLYIIMILSSVLYNSLSHNEIRYNLIGAESELIQLLFCKFYKSSNKTFETEQIINYYKQIINNNRHLEQNKKDLLIENIFTPSETNIDCFKEYINKKTNGAKPH